MKGIDKGSFLSEETIERLAKELSEKKGGAMPTALEISQAIEQSRVFPFSTSEEQMRADIEAAKSTSQPKQA